MKIRLRKPIRRDWIGHPAAKGLLLERDLSVRSSRLKAKLMVFRNRHELRSFWAAISDFRLGRTCMGAVNGMGEEHLRVAKDGSETRWLECDPRYFCVIGLVKGFLSMEIICHEAVHAGFAYARRVKTHRWRDEALQLDEEAVCYPSGAIAAAINRALYRAGLFE